MKNKLGQSLGVVSAGLGIFCPICYLAPTLAGLGLGSTLFFTALYFKYFLLFLIALSTVGYYLNYRTHKNIFPMLLTIVGGILIYYGQYVEFSQQITYVGVSGLVGAALFDFSLRRNKREDCKVCIPKLATSKNYEK